MPCLQDRSYDCQPEAFGHWQTHHRDVTATIPTHHPKGVPRTSSQSTRSLSYRSACQGMRSCPATTNFRRSGLAKQGTPTTCGYVVGRGGSRCHWGTGALCPAAAQFPADTRAPASPHAWKPARKARKLNLLIGEDTLLFGEILIYEIYHPWVLKISATASYPV